jgi:hypothetical protein
MRRGLAALFLAPVILSIGIAAFTAYIDPLYFIYVLLLTSIPALFLTLVFGLPLFLVLWKRVRPTIVWPVICGGLIGSVPAVVEKALSEPMNGYIDDPYSFMQMHHSLSSHEGVNDILATGAILFAFGSIAGMIFWAVAVQPWRRKNSK